MSFDNAAAQASKQEASQRDFARYNESQKPPVAPPPIPAARSSPPLSTTTTTRYTYHEPVYIPTQVVISTRPTRFYSTFNPYVSRPVVIYHDPYNSFFWWWLLDRTLDDRAYWTYHHQYDMDPARYQALVANDQQLADRVSQLEAQQVPRDPTYTPAGMDRDLMYSDEHIAQVYHNRPTHSGQVAFWVLGVPVAIGFTGFFIWLIWFKRWQTAT